MCDRYVLPNQVAAEREFLPGQAWWTFAERFNVAAQQYVPAIRLHDGQTEGKIDGAYAYAYTQYVSQNYGKEDNKDLYLHANQAGQAATIATVQSVTGQHIDHFVEVNLAGFYYLASAFNGIEVCILPAPAQGGFPAGANLTDVIGLHSGSEPSPPGP